MSVKKVTAQVDVDITFDGAFDNCHIGCDSCDFITNTHTKYKDGKATGLEVMVECQNAEQCRHLMKHLADICTPQVIYTGDSLCDKL